jgi:hypothetical protein
MTRSGYSDDCDGWDLVRWRGAVTSAIKGKRGQAFLREMLDALDAMPEKVLIAESLVEEDGAVCAMGAVGQKRGMDLSKVDPEDRHSVADAFGISPALAAEIAYENDEGTWQWRDESPAERWERMRNWIVRHIIGRNAP